MSAADAGKIYQDSHTTTVGATAVSATTFIIAKDVAQTTTGVAKKNANALTTTANFYGIGGTNVEVDLSSGAIKVDENYKNEKPKAINIPKRGKKALTLDSSYVELRRMSKTLTLTGWLTDDSGNITNTSPATTNTALNKKKTLEAMAEEGGPIRFYYRNEAFMCSIDDLKFGDEYFETSPNTTDPTNELVAKIDFIINMTVGYER